MLFRSVVTVARSLRDRWDSAWGTPSAPPRPYGGATAGHLHDFATQAGPVLARWHAECLSVPAAGHALTPRKAAAYWTVFHWNRAGLAAAEQALAAQTLAGRLPA